MCCHYNRSARTVNAVKKLHNAQRNCWVQVTRRLVADKQWWAVNHCASNRNTLLLTTRKLVWVSAHLLTKTYQTQNLWNLNINNRTGLANALKCKGNVLIDGLVWKQLKVLEDSANLATQIRNLGVTHTCKVLTSNNNLSVSCLLLTRDKTQER